MERLLSASREGDINGLYLAIQDDPTILEQIDKFPFIDTPLHIAASAGHVEYAMEIARLKPSFARKPNQIGSSPMHIALLQNQTKMVTWLKDFDNELVRVKGREGVTPLHYVIGRGELNFMEKFLSSCAGSVEDVTIRNETAFHIALKNGVVQAFDLLLEKLQSCGLEATARILNTKDLEGNTVLHLATATNQFQVIESLVRWHKSNGRMLQIDAENDHGQSAMQIADAHGGSPTIKLLLRQANQQNRTIIFQILKVLRFCLGMDTTWLELVYGKTVTGKTRSDLLVVAALMASATFQAVLNPPGGLDNTAHVASLSENSNYDPASSQPPTDPPVHHNSADLYSVVMTFNTIAFILSMFTIVQLIGNFPMFWTIYMAVLAMAITYGSSIVAITANGIANIVQDSVVMILFIVIIFYGVSFIRWLLIRRRRTGRKASANPNVP